MPAALTKGALNTAPLNTYPVEVPYTLRAVGAAVQREAFEAKAVGAHKRWEGFTLRAPGRYDNTIHTYRITATGARKQFNTFTPVALGKHSVAIIPVRLRCIGASRSFASYKIDAPGVAVHRNTITIKAQNEFRMQLPFEIRVVGAHQRGLGHVLTAPGRFNVAQPLHTRVYRQTYHVGDATLDRWELYVGVGAVPDFVTPAATGTTSPITFTPPLPGAGLTHTLYIVVRKRNSLDFLDFNQHPILIEIDENGDEVLGPITAPELSGVLDGGTAGSLQVWGRYPSGGDRNPADSWELYAVEGADPVVGTDPILISRPMGVAGGGNTTMRLTAAGLTPGATYHVRLAIRREADGAYAASAVAQITLIPVYDLVAEDAAMFAGEEYEINQ